MAYGTAYIEIDQAKCKVCKKCFEACPGSAFWANPKGPVYWAQARCNSCGACEESCPEKAITIEYREE